MNERESGSVRRTVGRLYREESARVLATLIRLLRDFDLAEEAVHDAFLAAATTWTPETVPSNPRAWLVSTGRFKAIDRLRRRGRFDALLAKQAALLEQTVEAHEPAEQVVIEDDRLRLAFVCCHPAIPVDAQIAMTLREVCGLKTEEIAHAFLTTAPTIAQRIVRAKAKIRDDQIPFETPERDDIADRLDGVLRVIYLVFNEGYSASSGDEPLRAELTAEAIRLGRLMVELLPTSETTGLLAMMLLNDSRRHARVSATGEIVLLDEQDRTLWDKAQIAEGLGLAKTAIEGEDAGPYAIQAAIAAEHAKAKCPGATNWRAIVTLYDRLLRETESPIVELNRAVAIGMSEGLENGVALIETLLKNKTVAAYHLAHSARAELLRRLGNFAEANKSLTIALSLCTQSAERRLLERRLAELS